jgi:hypothetical protein
MDITSLITQLVGGAVGGNAAGPALKENNPGKAVNTISGLVGGGLLVCVAGWLATRSVVNQPPVLTLRGA